MIKKVKAYKQAEMVGWFRPKMLLQTLVKSVVSRLFGNYADRREMEAALAKPDENYLAQLKTSYDGESLWIDFISDTGDGFDSTYSIASLVAKDSINVEVDGQAKSLPRGKILVLGGDMIYPTPTSDLYDQKFKIPFSSALPKKAADTDDGPHMYAIPGNHDWYDGLGNFIKIFCQKRNIGQWKTKQQRSYFAIPLPFNYWIWGTDVQLNADIDQPQLEYFTDIARNHMEADAKVILVTAEPAWIYRELYRDDKSYDRLKYFIERFFTKNVENCIDKTFILKAILTGDLHHYSHYKQSTGDLGEYALAPHLIGAGGGGAFLHFTHNLPENLHVPETPESLRENAANKEYASKAACYPSKKQSLKLNRKNMAFPFLNKYFCSMMGCLYLLIFWMLISSKGTISSFSEPLKTTTSSAIFSIVYSMLLTPSVCILTGLLFMGFYAFADIRSGRRINVVVGLLHAALQVAAIYLLIAILCVSALRLGLPDFPYLYTIILVLLIFFGGWITSGTLIGTYLYTTNLHVDMHLDEASSSIASPHYKNFLRIHLSKEGCTIYPIGIDKVVTNWVTTETDDGITFTGGPVEHHLIEVPYNVD